MHPKLRKTVSVLGAAAVAAGLAGGITSAWASDGPDDASLPTSAAKHAPADATPAQAVALETVNELPAGAVPADATPAQAAVLETVNELPAGAVPADATPTQAAVLETVNELPAGAVPADDDDGK